MLHAMLPDSSINTDKAATQPAMFVDTGLGALFRATYALKAEKRRMQICVAGGAQFLQSSSVFNIGQRNFDCLTELLRHHNLTIEAKDVGGVVSRTICLHVGTGEVRLKCSGQNQEAILFKGYASAR
jgi:chemotaxis protein CheD